MQVILRKIHVAMSWSSVRFVSETIPSHRSYSMLMLKVGLASLGNFTVACPELSQPPAAQRSTERNPTFAAETCRSERKVLVRCVRLVEQTQSPREGIDRHTTR